MKCLFVVFIAISIREIVATVIGIKAAKSYFDSGETRTFASKWKPYGQMYETTLGFTIQEAFGHNSMNVYINRFLDPLTLSLGYYHTDNQVKIVCQAVVLEALPHLYDIDMSFPLHNNLLQIEASVTKMILHTNYVLFRNKSDIIFVPDKQDTLACSPFRFQQVRNIGALAITVEGCSLYGSIVTTLSGNTVNLGYNDLKLKECQYSIEIYQLNDGAPPVIASYLPTGEKGLNLDDLLMQPITAELIPKLQAAMFSEINTSSLFNEDLAMIRNKQLSAFEHTLSAMDDLVHDMNQRTLAKNMGTVELNEFTIVWDDPFAEIPTAKAVKLTKMVLIGLDSLYASHAGGPVKLTNVEIVDQLRFSTLQVVGTITVEGFTEATEFAAEISDFAFDASLDASNKMKFDPRGWRVIEFSCPAMEFIAVESLVVGYLLKELPEHLKGHLNSVFAIAPEHLNAEINNDDEDEYASFNHEETVDGKYYANTHEIQNQNMEEYSNEEDEHVKLNALKENLEKYSYDEVKLNGVVEENQDKVENQGEVKLNQVAVKVEPENHEQVKLNHISMVPEVEDDDPVKVHVEVKPEPNGQGVNVNQGGVRAGASPRGRNSKNKAVMSNKLRSNSTSSSRIVSDEKAIKTSKGRGRNKGLKRVNKRHSAKRLNKTRVVKNQLIDNATALHISDNEIHSS